MGDNCLIGCLSTTPTQSPGSEQHGTSWLGSPAIFLPQRQQSSAFSAETTFQPSAWLQVQRALIELARVLLPSTFFIMLTSVLMSLVIIVREHVTETELILLFPILYAACGAVAALSVVAIKWLLMGRYRPCERPLWSTFVWRTELVTALHENLANLFVVDKLVGTPLSVWYFRLLGARIGRRAFLETTDMTEFDLITLGDDVALEQGLHGADSLVRRPGDENVVDSHRRPLLGRLPVAGALRHAYAGRLAIGRPVAADEGRNLAGRHTLGRHSCQLAGQPVRTGRAGKREKSTP